MAWGRDAYFRNSDRVWSKRLPVSRLDVGLVNKLLIDRVQHCPPLCGRQSLQMVSGGMSVFDAIRQEIAAPTNG